MEAERIATYRHQYHPLTYQQVEELCDALEAAQAENTDIKQANVELFEKCNGLWSERDRLASQVTDLKQYVVHRRECKRLVSYRERAWRHDLDACSCGLGNLLAWLGSLVEQPIDLEDGARAA